MATGTPTVLVLLEGRPRLIDAIADGADAIVMGYWPGMEGGEALADVLYGEVNPSGRLPFTYPRHPNALLAYDHRYTETLGTGFDRAPDAFDPQFAFGHGLSYTTFAYSDLRLSTNEVGEGEEVTVEVTVTNTGERVGKDAVLLFTRQHYAQLTPAMRRLRGFEKIELAPGASQTVAFTLTTDDLTYVGQDGEPVLDPGAFDVRVGDRTATFEVER
jgi:beta-glucosidase